MSRLQTHLSRMSADELTSGHVPCSESLREDQPDRIILRDLGPENVLYDDSCH